MILANNAPPDAPSNALAALSRNASVISSSSSSSSSSSINLTPTPTRLRPMRTFSPPRSRPRSKSPMARVSPLDTYAVNGLNHRASGLSIRPKGPPVSPIDSSSSSPRSRMPPPGPAAQKMAGRADFDFGEVLGEGSYSEVIHATYRATGKAYAIKVIHKLHLIKKEKTKYATVERDALATLTASGHPGVIQLFWTFQDNVTLYFVLSLAPNSELQSMVRRLGSLSLRCARYYTAQVVDTVLWMHDRGVIHRDLKPENILLDSDWRMKLTDFGSAKLMERGEDGKFIEDHNNTRSFVGSPQYVSPELLLDTYKYACKSSDLYAIGCILFQLISGQFLFHALTEYLTFDKIKRGDHTPFPDGFQPVARDLVLKLIPLHPADRLGATPKSSPSQLKAHPFFSSSLLDGETRLPPVDWATLWTIPAPQLEPGLVRWNESEQIPAVQWEDFDVGWAQETELSDQFEEMTTNPGATIRGREDVRGNLHRVASASRSSGSPSDGVSAPEDLLNDEGLLRTLRPGERPVHAVRAQVRRAVLGGLLRSARTRVLVLTSNPARLLALKPMREGMPWRVESAFGFALGAEGEVVVGVDPRDERTFAVRTSQRTFCVVVDDAARWIQLVREVILV